MHVRSVIFTRDVYAQRSGLAYTVERCHACLSRRLSCHMPVLCQNG